MKRIWVLIVAAAVIAGLAGCSSQPTDNPQAAASNSDTTASADSSKLPFDSAPKKGLFSGNSLVPKDTNIAAGTPMTVRLESAISSATANAGDAFDAVLDEPLVVNGETVAPKDTAVRGRVLAARKSGRLHNSGYLRIALSSMELNGKSVPIQTSSIFVAGGSHKKRDIAMIGGGAGGGALIGALAGGGKGALIGSMVGAGAGTGAAYATGKKDVGFGVERRLTFRLTAPVTAKK
jgi:hypothetical protein